MARIAKLFDTPALGALQVKAASAAVVSNEYGLPDRPQLGTIPAP